MAEIISIHSKDHDAPLSCFITLMGLLKSSAEYRVLIVYLHTYQLYVFSSLFNSYDVDVVILKALNDFFFFLHVVISAFANMWFRIMNSNLELKIR